MEDEELKPKIDNNSIRSEVFIRQSDSAEQDSRSKKSTGVSIDQLEQILIDKDRAIEEKLHKLEESIKKVVNESGEEFTKKIKVEQEKAEDKFDQKIDSSKISIIETLGIFIALFTFISIDFQVFKSYRDPVAISGLTLILLASIGFLMSIFDFFILEVKKLLDENSVIHARESFVFRRLLFVLELLLIILGVILFNKSKPEDFEQKATEIKAEIKNDVFDYTRNTQDNFYKRGDLQETIQESQNSKQILDCFKNKKNFSIECFEN